MESTMRTNKPPGSGHLLQDRGVTLLEMLVVIGVISVLITIATYGYTTYLAAKGAQEARVLDTAANCLRSLYARDPGYLGAPGSGPASTAVAVNNNCFPKAMVTAGFGTDSPTLNNLYGGEIEVEPDSVNGAFITIISRNLPADTCRSVGAALIGAYRIDVKSSNLDPLDSATQVRFTTTGLNQSLLGTACGTGTAAVIAYYTR
jgi:prepilin-type N-terminal cleavage/methylation domain-containing protein